MSSVAATGALPSPSLLSRLDTVLGKVTMYRLILLVLGVLALFSMVLNILGWLTFGLPEMVVHLVLCLALSYGANRLLALMFSVRPHSESSLITGLLIYFLFWPSLEIRDMTGTALACVLAVSSKYALAWNGRHIFNPAALGIFIVGLTGLNIATWWAATPAMLWLLVPGVLVVLYRTRKWLLAGVFLVVSTGIIMINLAQAGMGPGDSLWQALAQRPGLFLVGFMLTEPLTLPPRRWQQLGVAAVVGVAFAVPYNFGFIANTPEAALLLGNVLAFMVGQRRGIRLKFAGSRALTPSNTEFTFTPHRPVRFAPGQYMELNLPHAKSDGKGRRRVFSVSSAPSSRQVTFGVQTAAPVSTAKQALLALEPGDVITATAVGGDFLPPKDTTRPRLLIATGIGITPFISHLLADKAARSNDVVLYLARTAGELGYGEELRNTGARIIALTTDRSTPPEFMEDASSVVGPAGARVTSDVLKTLVPDVSERAVFVSGSPASVSALKAAARRAGARKVHSDVFSGY